MTDPSILELQSQGYPELERGAEEFLADSQLVDKVALSPSLLGSKKDGSRAITKPKTPSALEPIKLNFSGKRKRKEAAGAPSDIDLAILAELKNKDEETDEDSLFMKSLVPQLKRLDSQKKSFVKCQIQQFLFQAEFGTIFNGEKENRGPSNLQSFSIYK